MPETDLYPPIKAFLQGRGYEVKSEIGASDVMAVRGDEPPVIVELKQGFSLTLIHQCVARLRVCDNVYMAIFHGKGRRFSKSLKDMNMLCRRLGLGLITVREPGAQVLVHCDPGPYVPRKSKPHGASLLAEFNRRRGDPNSGGQGRAGLITAYRQDAMRLAQHLYQHGAAKGAHVAQTTHVPAATRMMRDNHYGWFEKRAPGIYGLSPKGMAMLSAQMSPDA